MPLINCEVYLTLTWSEKCVLISKATRDAAPGVDAVNNPTNARLKIKLLEQLKAGFKRTIKWNKYRSKMSNQARNNNLNYLTDPTFTNVNRLFVLSFGNETDRNSFSDHYVPKVELKDFNVLIDGKPFFEIPVKNKEEAY